MSVTWQACIKSPKGDPGSGPFKLTFFTLKAEMFSSLLINYDYAKQETKVPYFPAIKCMRLYLHRKENLRLIAKCA